MRNKQNNAVDESAGTEGDDSFGITHSTNEVGFDGENATIRGNVGQGPVPVRLCVSDNNQKGRKETNPSANEPSY